MNDLICLDKSYSTTRLVTKEKTAIANKSEKKFTKESKAFETLLFLPEGKERHGEGGLRTRGYYKKSYDGKPLISIITVVYNGEKYLEETIQSVINQTYDNVEYIIIDGGSTDGTLDIIKKYKDKIDYFISEKDNGIYDAMNKGIKSSTGEWINFMNAGDTFCTEKTISQIIANAVKNDTLNIIYGNNIVLDEKGTIIKELKALPLSKSYLNMFSTRVLCHQAVFVHKNIVVEYSFDYHIKGDLNWYYDILKYTKKSKILKLNIPITNYLLGGFSSQNIFKDTRERLQIIYKQNSLIVFIASLPFLILPFIFKAKHNLTRWITRS